MGLAKPRASTGGRRPSSPPAGFAVWQGSAGAGSARAGDADAPASSGMFSQRSDAGEVCQPVQTIQVEQLCSGSPKWEELVSFLCPVLKWDLFCIDTLQHLPWKKSNISPLPPPLHGSVFTTSLL